MLLCLVTRGHLLTLAQFLLARAAKGYRRSATCLKLLDRSLGADLSRNVNATPRTLAYTFKHRSSCLTRRKLEEWPDDGDPKELRLEVKAGEEMYLEQLIRFCYSKEVTLTEGQCLQCL